MNTTTFGARTPGHSRPRGSAMTMTLAGVALATATLLALVETSSSSQRYTNGFVDDQTANYTSRGYAELAVSDLWGGFQLQLKTNPNLDLIEYLNGKYTWTSLPIGQDTIADNMRLPNDTIEFVAIDTYDNIKLGTKVPTKFNLYRRVRNDVYPNTTMVRQRNVDILVAAESQSNLGFNTPHDQAKFFKVSGNENNAEKKRDLGHANWVGQYLTFSNPPNYKGLEFGVLTKNVQCTLCHLHVNSVEKAFNKDPSKFNTFPKVKIGSTNLMGLNASADTIVEGEILQRGSLQDDFSAMTLSASSAAARLKAFALNPDGTIKQDSSGNGTVQVCTNTTSTSGGQPIAPATGGNFYANYASDPTNQSEGILPNGDFPTPFPDIPHAADNNLPNHKIDPDEVALAMSDAVANSNPALPGTIRGGIALTLSPGTAYTATTLPVSGSPANITTGLGGNAILTGSSDNPIQIDGKVVIDGDVIIRGYVQGTGQILATGNIYIFGDVIYKDKFSTVSSSSGSPVVQENFGLDANNNSNLLGLVAGKNIIVGDYLSQVTHWNEQGGSNPDFFKPRHLDSNNQVVVDQGKPEPGRVLTLATDRYLNPAQVTVIPGSYTDSSSGKKFSTYSQPNFTLFQLGMFNQLEYTKTLQKLPDYGDGNPYNPKNASAYRVDNSPANNPNDSYDPNYIPRFYSFYKYDAQNPKTNPVYVSTTGWQQSPDAGGNGGAWNVAEQRWDLIRHSGDPVNFTDLADIPSSVQSPASLAKKVVLNIHPDWISPSTMMQIISSEELTRQSGTRRIDGLLYTSNALLAIERKLVQTYDPVANIWSNGISKGGGNLQINGAVIAPDMGVIVPDGQFNVNYDQRVASLLKLSASSSAATTSASGASGSTTNVPAAQWGMMRKGFSKFNGSMPTQPGADDDDGNHGKAVGN